MTLLGSASPAADSRPFQAIIFDVGRVIVRVDVHRALEPLSAASHLPAEEVWARIQADPLWRDWQEGRVRPRDWHERMARRLGFQLSFDAFRDAWNRALDPTTMLPEELFAGLAREHRLLLLSNTDPIHVQCLEENFPFVRHFPARVYSCTVGASKPAPAIYGEAIRQAAAPPDRILYVDDVQEYVDAGRRAGLHGILFRGQEELLQELRSCRVL